MEHPSSMIARRTSVLDSTTTTPLLWKEFDDCLQWTDIQVTLYSIALMWMVLFFQTQWPPGMSLSTIVLCGLLMKLIQPWRRYRFFFFFFPEQQQRRIEDDDDDVLSVVTVDAETEDNLFLVLQELKETTTIPTSGG